MTKRHIWRTALVLFAFVAVACGEQSTTTQAGPPPEKATYSKSPEWQAVGAQATAARDKARAEGKTIEGHPIPPAAIPPKITDPIDIAAPGVYEFKVGPVPPNLDIQQITVSFPPDVPDYFEWERSGPVPALVQQNGATFLVFRIQVREVKSPYQGLQIWFH